MSIISDVAMQAVANEVENWQRGTIDTKDALKRISSYIAGYEQIAVTLPDRIKCPSCTRIAHRMMPEELYEVYVCEHEHITRTSKGGY